ncbi:MAG: DNA/RNA non-specific endonuclease [Clostridia bacterium]|nr:DNA/RNA non-specific endonuclease [Clostridia bacterium]
MPKLNLRLTALLLSIIMLISLLCGCRQTVSLDEIPDYYGSACVEINGGSPFFTDNEITDVAFERYSELDALGRCGVAFACIGIEIMPTEERGEIASVTPTGWEYGGISNNNQYDFIGDGYVYNRCHLIGFQLAGENDNEKNLITGTRYMNIDGMLPYENEVADYVEESGNHVMYRVTPIYNGLDYVARGVLMEAYSVEDNGRGVQFCVYAYNVQPGVTIDYFTGVNVANGEELPEIPTNDGRGEIADTKPEDSKEEEVQNPTDENVECDYVLNTNSKKFHYPGKSCSDRIGEDNREYFNGTRDELIADGYSPCGICKP